MHEMDVAFRVPLVAGAVMGIAVSGCAGDLEWPFITVSDILSSSGGAILYGSWILYFGIAARRGIHQRIAAVAVLAPLFPLPRGGVSGSIVDIDLVTKALVMHYIWAVSYITAVLLSPSIGIRRVSSVLVLPWGVAYFGGQLIACDWIVFLGCVLEWALLFAPAMVSGGVNASPKKTDDNKKKVQTSYIE
jgi:hypothetical protein